MLTSELVTKIIGADGSSGIIQDSSYTEAMVINWLNEAQISICGGGERSHGLPLLAPMPELLTSGTVTLAVDSVSVAMPATFHRAPIAVIDSSGYILKNIESYLSFLLSYPKPVTGNTIVYCRKGSTLFYAPSKAHDVTVHFYRLPVDMDTDVDSKPDGIPIHLHERLFVSAVCSSIFSEIEDGMEGQKVNTMFWANRYQSALTDLERFIGPVDKLPESVGDDSDYIGSF